MPVDEKSLLVTALRGVRQEYDRIRNLIRHREDHPLGKYGRAMGSKFARSLNAFDTDLTKMEEAVSGDVAPKEGWAAYVRLRTDLIPSLSNELLAVIGGIHLMNAKLDYVTAPADDEAEIGEDVLRFSDIAQELVRDLDEHGAGVSAPVLIVGEERISHAMAEIIRLRFPACDIWHLPFTVHEYGYLVAEIRPPERFSEFRSEVEQNVNPEKHSNYGRPRDESCFLPRVVELWDEYYSKRTEKYPERDRFTGVFERELSALRRQQRNILCRLFADCFAALFAGPAYVFALLHLQFVPDTTLFAPSGAMPAFADRFVFALETLRWMNEIRRRSSAVSQAASGWREGAGGLFAPVLDETVGVPSLWRAALGSTGHTDAYDNIVKRYEPWLARFQQILRNEFRVNLERTLEDCQTANELRLGEVLDRLEKWPSKWAVMNAAWTARWEASSTDEWSIVETNAYRLLGERDPSLMIDTGLKRVAPFPTSGARNAEANLELQISEAIKKVRRGLIDFPDALELFLAMSKTRDFQREKIVEEALISQEDVFRTYLNLCTPSYQQRRR
ncbi:MAG: hypothetical protein ACJ746_13605 [Bryobacteraceae bacterium]